jgi:deazaflavin-dependent oxidoreductase (nitroreductase family)
VSDRNEKIIKEFRDNEGRVGGPFADSPMILIHHVGARTGTERVAPLVYFPQPDGSMLIIASKGGAPTNPDWYHNLKANPKIDVEVGTDRFAVVADELDRAERDEVWPALVAERPGFGGYQEKTDRIIPVFRLRRTD